MDRLLLLLTSMVSCAPNCFLVAFFPCVAAAVDIVYNSQSLMRWPRRSLTPWSRPLYCRIKDTMSTARRYGAEIETLEQIRTSQCSPKTIEVHQRVHQTTPIKLLSPLRSTITQHSGRSIYRRLPLSFLTWLRDASRTSLPVKHSLRSTWRMVK